MSSIVKNLGYRVNHGDIDVKKLSAVLDRAYAAKNKPEFKQKTSFAPSGMGFQGRCPRYWFIAFDGAEFIENRRGEDYANMQAGTDAHERIGALLGESDLEIIDLEKEFWHDDPPIHGFIDGIINRAGEEVILEVKTTRAEAFRARQAKMQASDYQLIQLLIYMYLRGAQSGVFLFENKNTHEILLIPVYMDDKNRETVEKTLRWMREVKTLHEDRLLPKHPFQKNSKVCKKCPVRNSCFDADQYGEGDVEFDPLPTVR